MEEQRMKFEHSNEGVDKMVDFFTEDLKEKWLDKFAPRKTHVSVIFLAWAPWAGKSEFIEMLETDKYVVLDTDLYRSHFEGYVWTNASEFQKMASRVMSKLFSFCMKNGVSVIVDWTFANHEMVSENLKKCARFERDFAIVLIYQDPVFSYLYTKRREVMMTRNVPKEVFIQKYYDSISNVFSVLAQNPEIPFLIGYKNKKGEPAVVRSIQTKDKFDKRFKVKYNHEELIEALAEIDSLIKNREGRFSLRMINKLISSI